MIPDRHKRNLTINDQSKLLFDTILMKKTVQKSKQICFHARKKYFLKIKDGNSGKEVLKSLRQYRNILLQQIKKRLNRHSKYFLLYHYRRILAVHLSALSEKINWKEEDLNTFRREILYIYWLYNRITLAVLKYGNSNLIDMQMLSPRVKGTSGHSIPNLLTDSDTKDLHMTLYLMMEYEEIRYRMKRAGKGGKFVWKNKEKLEFDVVLESSIQNLVDIFDKRVTVKNNLLSFSGTWAPTMISNEFPLPSPNGAYIPLHIWPRAVVTTCALSYNTPVVLTLLPNIGGQGNDLGWREPVTNQLIPSPIWIFQWYYLESLLPRIELFRGYLKKHLEFSKRPSYEPEDLIFSLSAITQGQIKSCLENNVFWCQIFCYGYSIFTEPHEVLKQRALPEFQNLRKKYLNVPPSNEDWNKLKLVIEDIKWDENKYKKIDILRFSPINLIFPIDKNMWLIDWSLMLQVILDLFGPYGRTIGTIAMLRGKDFEKTLAEYFQAHLDELGISMWWLGQGATNMLKFHVNGKRDVDIGIIADNHLLILEIKAYAGRRDLLFIGDPDSLSKRWENAVKPAINQVDTLSERLSKEPKGKNFEIPREIKWVVPIVCGPFVEWIPSSDKRWWLYDDIPRFCTPDEVLEVISRIKEGNFPKYKLNISWDR